MVKMNLAEVQTQTKDIKNYCHSLKTSAENLTTVAGGIGLDIGISGTAGDSIKAYLASMYPALAQTMIMQAEDIETCHQAYVDGYISTCGGASLDSEELEPKIADYDTIIQDLETSKTNNETWYQGLDPTLQQGIRSDYQELMNSLNASITTNTNERKILQDKLEQLLEFDALSPQYFSGCSESASLMNEGLQLLGGDVTTDQMSGGSWNGHGFHPIDSEWRKRVQDGWRDREDKLKIEKEKARTDAFKQQVKGRTYQRVDVANGASVWMWVKDPMRVSSEDFKFNEDYADYLRVINQPEESNIVEDYFINMAEELKTGINSRTGKPLTTLEKIQRWSAVASGLTLIGVAGYYGAKGLAAKTPETKVPKGQTKKQRQNQKKLRKPVGLPELFGMILKVPSLLEQEQLFLNHLKSMLMEKNYG